MKDDEAETRELIAEIIEKGLVLDKALESLERTLDDWLRARGGETNALPVQEPPHL